MVFDRKSLEERLLERWADPGQGLHPTLGQRGYSIPDIRDFEWHALPGGLNNWALTRPGTGAPINNNFRIGNLASNNVLVFDEESKVTGNHYIVGSDNIAIFIGSRTGINPVNVHFHGHEGVLYFGEECTSNTTTFELGGQKTSIIAGYDCMFSAGIQVMASDEHAMVDLTDGKFLNPARSICFEPHVWIGFQAIILKGTRIGFGAVVGARSVVTRDVPPNTAVAGNPARVVRSGIGWVRSKEPVETTVSDLLALARTFAAGE